MYNIKLKTPAFPEIKTHNANDFSWGPLRNFICMQPDRFKNDGPKWICTH